MTVCKLDYALSNKISNLELTEETQIYRSAGYAPPAEWGVGLPRPIIYSILKEDRNIQLSVMSMF